MVECLGPFPLEFLKHCEDRGKYFDEKGECDLQPHLTILSSTINDFLHLGTLLQTNRDFAPSTLEDILRDLKVVDESEILGTAAFLRRCLMLDPKLRPSAQELLRDGWLL